MRTNAIHLFDKNWNLATSGQKDSKKVNQLLKDIERSNFEGLGKPEALKGNLSGFWSRRIDDANRLIYRINGEFIDILSCKGHYEDVWLGRAESLNQIVAFLSCPRKRDSFFSKKIIYLLLKIEFSLILGLKSRPFLTQRIRRTLTSAAIPLPYRFAMGKLYLLFSYAAFIGAWVVCVYLCRAVESLKSINAFNSTPFFVFKKNGLIAE